MAMEDEIADNRRSRSGDDAICGVFADSDAIPRPPNPSRRITAAAPQKVTRRPSSPPPPHNPNPSVSADDLLPSGFTAPVQKRKREPDQPASSTAAKYGTNVQKMMLNMGYKPGTGLGKDGQGIVEPIQPTIRPKHMALGFHEPQKPMAVDQPVPRLSNKYSEKIQKKRYSTVEQAVPQQEKTVYKVLDMRGREPRVVTDLAELNAEEGKESRSPFDEISHNSRLSFDVINDDLLRQQNDIQQRRERLTSMLREREQYLETRDSPLSGVNEAICHAEQGTLTLDSLLEMFTNIKDQFTEEFELWNVHMIACKYAQPLMMQVFAGWEPLEKPEQGLELMSSWRDFMQHDPLYYTELFGEVVLHPTVTMSLRNTWEARDPEPMLRFLESWDGVMPPSLRLWILGNIVLPKLTAAVESWDPKRDALPIHVWVHPWLPLLGQRLEVLCETVRFKLCSVLQAWEAQDDSAFHMLSPWKDVFSAASWKQLIARYIVPKLKITLQSIEINPANQKLDQLDSVLLWTPIIPVQQMVTMLEIGFLNKWHHVLWVWLSSDPDINEVAAWYDWYWGWKSRFPEELLANEHIRTLLSIGLNMMDNAAGGIEMVQPRARLNTSHLRQTQKRQSDRMDEMDNAAKRSFKEMIQAYAVDKELLFVPKVGRSYNGLPVYGFGNVVICLDSVKELVIAKDGDVWAPVSLTKLIEMHTSRVRH